MTVQETLFQAIVAALDGVGKPTGLVVHREPAVPLEEDAEKSVVFYPLARTRARGELGGPLEYVLDFATELRRKVSTTERAAGLTASEALDELYDWTVSALQADPTFGGVALALDEISMEWDQDLQNRLHGRSAVRWSVRFWAERDDPSTGAP